MAIKTNRSQYVCGVYLLQNLTNVYGAQVSVRFVIYEQMQYAPPTRDSNAPDLYIPLMGFLTYILIVGYSKGTSNQYVAKFVGLDRLVRNNGSHGCFPMTGSVRM